MTYFKGELLDYLVKAYLCAMRKFLDIPLSILYILFFIVVLLIFHPLQWIAFTFFGAHAHQKVVQWMAAFCLYSTGITGSMVTFFNNQKIDTSKKYVIISNHQSMFDIIGIIWFFKKINPIFVSKKSLAKNLPSVSYNLRKSGAALIDRGDRRQAIQAIKDMCLHAEKHHFTPVIFPEGTRSRNGAIKPFLLLGTKVIVDTYKPDYIIPVLINKTGTFNYKGLFPFRAFTKMTFEVMPIIKPDKDLGAQLKRLETSYNNAINFENGK